MSGAPIDAQDLGSVITGVGVLISLSVTIISTVQVIRNLISSHIREVLFGEIDIPGSPIVVNSKVERHSKENGDINHDFEIDQVEKYYKNMLSKANISFWFSLIFASIGFAIIILSTFMFSIEDKSSAIFKLSAGIVVDAVAALFFSQSRSLHASMLSFFDKLRDDRKMLEIKNLIASIESPDMRDDIKYKLALHYSGFEDLAPAKRKLARKTNEVDSD